MNEKKQFYSLIKPVQKLLFIEFLLRNLQNFLFFSALACCFWLLISRFIVFPYLFAAISYTIVLLVIFFGWFAWKKHPTERDAVNRFNQFVPDDRVISAYYFIEKDGEVETLLVQNAIQQSDCCS